ncbi:phage tail protein [Allofournierella sp. CML151]|uniref:phage tail protein n=1 Tax=Allofournierella sp. CML151 TaxID=2998082 RepID=UPI0022EB61B4|nr:hypothetical protein [Fournierella sp. CML151]
MGAQKKFSQEAQKATELQTKALEKQKDAIDESKEKLNQWAVRAEQSMKKLQSGMSGLGKGIAAIGGPLVTGALGMLGGGLAGMLKENETLKASLESVKSSLQGAFAPITEAVLPLVDTFAQTIIGLAQTVAPLLSNVLGSVSEVAAGMLSGVDLSGLLTPLTAGLDGILGLFSKLGQATGTWMQGLDLSGLAGSFAGLASAIGPVVQLAMGGLAWAWQNVLLPLSGWAIQSVAPAFFDLLSAAMQALNPIVEAFQPFAQYLWESFLQPLAEWTGGVVVSVIEGIVNGLTLFSAWISENMELVQLIVTLVGSFAAAWVLVNTALAVWNVISLVATAGATALGAAVAFLTSPVTLIIAGIAALIAVVALLITHWDQVKQAGGAALQFLQEIWAAACEWFNAIVVQPLAALFSTFWQIVQNLAQLALSKLQAIWGTLCGWMQRLVIEPLTSAWTGFKDIMLNLWDGIAGGVRGAVNSIIGFVNGMIRGAVDGVNTVIRLLNSISFRVPDWVWGIGGETFGFDIPTVSAPQIPMLARGGVIRQPVLAMMGEYAGAATNPEIAAPESRLRELMAEQNGPVLAAILQLAQAVSSGGARELVANQPIEVKLDGQVLYRAMAKIEANRGVKIGGAFANAY